MKWYRPMKVASFFDNWSSFCQYFPSKIVNYWRHLQMCMSPSGVLFKFSGYMHNSGDKWVYPSGGFCDGDDIMLCFSRESNSIFTLSLSVTGTHCNGWTPGGTLGVCAYRTCILSHQIRQGILLELVPVFLGFVWVIILMIFLQFDLFQPFLDSTILRSSVCTTRLNVTKPYYMDVCNTISISMSSLRGIWLW